MKKKSQKETVEEERFVEQSDIPSETCKNESIKKKKKHKRSRAEKLSEHGNLIDENCIEKNGYENISMEIKQQNNENDQTYHKKRKTCKDADGEEGSMCEKVVSSEHLKTKNKKHKKSHVEQPYERADQISHNSNQTDHKKKKKKHNKFENDEVAIPKEEMNNFMLENGNGKDEDNVDMKKQKKKKNKSKSKDCSAENGENLKEKKISKRKLVNDKKIIGRARNFVDVPDEVEEPLPEEALLKKKMKEIKREKMRINKLNKKEEKEKAFKRRETDEFAESAISYLHLWKENKDSWSFKTNLQMWLLSSMYNDQKVKDSDFHMLIQYMLHSKGAARQRTVEQAEKIIECWDNREDGIESLESSIKNIEYIDESLYQRARDIVQTLI